MHSDDIENLHRDGGSAQHGRMKLLIIDDEPVNVALLQDILAESGYTRVQSVTDSRTAVDTCLAFIPDLVLLDLMMARGRIHGPGSSSHQRK